MERFCRVHEAVDIGQVQRYDHRDYAYMAASINWGGVLFVGGLLKTDLLFLVCSRGPDLWQLPRPDYILSSDVHRQ